MTDGAGRISKSLAIKIATKLGLTNLPSGFQERIGKVEGFWSFGNSERPRDWIQFMRRSVNGSPARANRAILAIELWTLFGGLAH